MEIRDFLTMTADLNENYRIYIDQDAKKQLNFLKKEQKLMFFVNETPQYVFGLKISNDKILLS